ncbi:MAG: hypothetical protein J0L82_02985 [Deltaproteobacteria bacterium]|nr:hypothetical protein [Deltaproteobacteria bacterium]
MAVNEVFEVEPETAALQIERIDFASQGQPVVVRSFSRNEKEPGLFGTGWCSNIDVNLIGVESGSPKVIELRQCGALKPRTFHKVLDAWVEDSSSSRILKKADGRWELTESPHPIFRHDGKLDSFSTSANVRWHVRRDSSGRPEALDNLKNRPVKFRRNLSGDLDAMLDSTGKVILRYELGLMLVKTDSKDVTENFEYDSDGNILRLLRKESKDDRIRTWRFSYTNPEWLSAVQWPDGCTSAWLFDRSGSVAVARESKNCQKPMLNEALRPVLAAPAKPVVNRQITASPAAVAPNGGTKSIGIEIIKPGPMGLGKERASVSVNPDGLPVDFRIEGSITRRLEIIREAGSGSVLLLRSGETEVNFRKKPRQYEPKQLELLDEYEEWMSAWGAR